MSRWIVVSLLRWNHFSRLITLQPRSLVFLVDEFQRFQVTVMKAASFYIGLMQFCYMTALLMKRQGLAFQLKLLLIDLIF